MEIDFSTAAIGFAAILAFVLPIAFIYSSTQKTKKQAFRLLESLASANNCALLQKEHFASFCMGIDNEKKMFFFVDTEIKSEQSSIVIKLENFNRCVIDKETIEVKSETTTTIEITKLMLRFRGKEGHTDQQVVLYDGEKKAQVFGELQLAERWKKIIDTAI